jgi:molybdopterin converting factor small subunit
MERPTSKAAAPAPAGALPPLGITVLLFAQAREAAGRDRLQLELPAGSRVQHALEETRRLYPALEVLWPHLAVALDGALVARDAALHDGAELALLPPVSGG